MRKFVCSSVLLAVTLLVSSAQVGDNLVVEGVPAIPAALKAEVERYLEFRAAAFNSWHPTRLEMLITTRFADAVQLHHVKLPGGARRQLTFSPEPVAGGSYRPKTAEFIIFSQDTGGGEFYQLYRYDPTDGKISLITDGKSRNSGPHWSNSGQFFAYTSTRRNGKDTDLYRMNPADPASDKLVAELDGGGWRVSDWSPDDTRLLLVEYLSINESHFYLVDVQTGARELITPMDGLKIAWSQGQFAADGKSLFVTTDKDAEFQRLCRFEFATKKLTALSANIPWDVENFDLSPNGGMLAFVVNEDGASVLHLINAASGRELRAPKLPLGVITGLSWHENNRNLAFTLGSAKSPNDVYSFDVQTGQLERWTESETGGLNPQHFVEPEFVRLKSFDGLPFSAFTYRPEPARFPGKRPVLISIHGGPESQSRPIFQARNNYFLNELGMAIVYPNVRGSDGYGKKFLTLDNGFQREDAVKDIGALIAWLKTEAGIDGDRLAVYGGSYGGYMVLASMEHFGDDLRCGSDVVGISNFLTFLKNTQDYRRDLRRVEYGDERDPKMAAFLERISPTTHVKKITKPLLVVQGKNDPRVPVMESEQMVRAIRDNGGQVWYLMARDEGHGFRKKKNADFQFLCTVLFFKEHLLR